MPDTLCVQERLPPGAAAVLINRAHTFTDIYLPIDARENHLVDAIDGERSIREIAGDEPRDVCRALFERLWWHDQVVFDSSRANRPRADVKRARHPHACAALMSLAFVLPARAQSPPSVGDTADRPGFADSPILLGRGRIQIESGFSWEQDGRGASLTKTSTLAELELHGGLTPRLELSLAWDGLVSSAAARSESNAKRRSTGWADVRLGAKFGLVDRPDFDAALIWYTNLPVGSSSVVVALRRSPGSLRVGSLNLGSRRNVGDCGSRSCTRRR